MRAGKVIAVVAMMAALHSAGTPAQDTAPGVTARASEPGNDPAAEERAKAASALREKALELLGDRNYDASTTAHFAVRTDDPRLLVKKAADMLESFGTFFEGFWSGRADLKPWEGRTEVLLFYSRYKYDRLYSQPGAPTSRNSIGHYQPYLGVIVAHSDSLKGGDLPGLLVHEVAHQLTHQRLYGEGAHVSIWLLEGLGTYFGFTRMTREGGFEAGEIGGAVPALVRGESSVEADLPRRYLSVFRRLVREADPGFLDDLIRTETQGLFHVEEESLKYVASWLLVHYLLHGEGGALAGALARYIRLDAEGQGSPETFYDLTGRSAEQLEAGFLAYVKKLKAR